VKVVFDPEVRDDLSLILYADEPIDCSTASYVVYPHSYPRTGVTVTGAIQVDAKTCEGYFTRQMGFGDIAQVFGSVEDLCGVGGLSDGRFEREVIPDNDVIITHNRISLGTNRDCVGIYYNVPSPGRVKISIFTRDGNLVKILLEENAESGQYSVEWCGENWRGDIVASGIYVIVVETPWYTFRGKAIVVK